MKAAFINPPPPPVNWGHYSQTTRQSAADNTGEDPKLSEDEFTKLICAVFLAFLIVAVFVGRTARKGWRNIK